MFFSSHHLRFSYWSMIFLWHYHTKTSTNFSKKNHNMYPKNTISRINKTNPANNCFYTMFLLKKRVFFQHQKTGDFRFFFGKNPPTIIHQKVDDGMMPSEDDFRHRPRPLFSETAKDGFFRVFSSSFFLPPQKRDLF